jgi:CheY-like chemotaxis protein
MTSSQPPTGNGDPRGRKRRLLVLDSHRYQKVFEALLGDDYELLATDKAGEAVVIAASRDPDVILLCSSTEGSDGVAVAKLIRQSTPSIAPILLILTSDRPSLRREAREAGCSGFLIKPIDPEKLRSQIAECLNGGHSGLVANRE